jgi:hypothetical protein
MAFIVHILPLVRLAHVRPPWLSFVLLLAYPA